MKRFLWSLLLALTAVAPLRTGSAAPAPDRTKPTVQITAPAANSRTPLEVVRVTGRATDNIAVAGVDIFLNGILQGTQQPNANRTWIADVPLTPGLHEIAAESIDTSGNRSIRAKLKITRFQTAPLELVIGPGGSVTGATNGQPLEISKRYTIRAIPETGYIFAGWSGAVTSSAASISFTMAPGTKLQAKFRATTFNGLFFPHMYDFAYEPITNYFGNIDAIAPTNSGSFSLTRAANGTASGKLVLEGRTLPFSGVIIRSDDTADFAIRRYGKPTLYVSFDIINDQGLESLTGAIDDGEFVADLAADSVARVKNPLVGKYNYELTPGSDDPINPPAAPPGASIGGIRITGTYASIVGSMADGTAINSSSQISGPLQTGEAAGETYLPVYIPLQAGRGMVIGWMTFNTNTNLTPHILGPEIHWFKAPAPLDKYYRSGFSVTREARGFRYTVPSLSQNSLGWNIGSLYLDYGNLQLLGEGENAFPEIQKRALISRAKITLENDPNAPLGTPTVADLRISLTVNPTEGTVLGSFRHPVSGATTRINGTILQRQPTQQNPNYTPYVSGYFLGADQAGDVVIVQN